jgi:hypothetical protein
LCSSFDAAQRCRGWAGRRDASAARALPSVRIGDHWREARFAQTRRQSAPPCAWKALAGVWEVMRTVADLPPPVAAAAAVRAEQRGIPWARPRWQQALPAYTHLLDELPSRLDRATVRRSCERAEPHEALVITMAWGFAKTGYGLHRVQKMLATDGLHDRLATVLGRSTGTAHLRRTACWRRVPHRRARASVRDQVPVLPGRVGADP